MATTIKLKTGSGSDPSASDLIVGEIAIRTDSGKLFTKKDNGSVAEISGGGGIDDGDKGDITVSNGGDTFTIDNGVVTSAKIADGTIVNADINGSAAIAGSKISPAFTGNITGTGDLFLTADTPKIRLIDSNADDDFQISNFSGNFIIKDITNSVDRFTIESDGTTSVANNLDVGAGIDVTGDITGTGDLTLTSTDAGSSASPIIELFRNSASPADADYLGQLKFSGESDDGSKEVYAKMTAKIDDASSGTEDGLIEFALRKAGSNNIGARLTSTDLKLINGTGLEVAGNITVDGTVDGVDIATRNTLFGGLTSSSGVLTNGVTATTQGASDNTTKVATTAYVTTAISNLINGAPSALDTLNELAAAMNDDAAFSTTVTNSLATKMPLAGGEFTGNVTFSGSQTVDGRDLSVDGAKLDTIESNATADQTASEILTLIKTVDGAGSGLDADTLDGISSASFLRSDANDTYSAALTISGTLTLSNTAIDTLNFSGNATDDRRGISFNGKAALTADNSDGYLRINNNAEFSNGVFVNSVLRADGGFSVGSTNVINSSGQVIASRVQTLNQNTTGSAATLTTARTIAGTSFDGSANIDISYANLTNKLSVGDGGLTQNNFTNALKSKLDGIAASATNVTNNNQLTNGAGYITATLTNEQVQDIVGGMVTGNTESGITVTYQDSDGTLDFVIGTLGTSNIANNAIDFSKMQDISAGRIVGNASGSTANPDQLTAAQVRTIINVEDGATADQTASEILTLIKTVDGSGSGLDADTLDGISSASFVRSDADDTLNGQYTISDSANEKLVLAGSSSPYIRFQENTTNKAYIQWHSDGYLNLVNSESSEALRIQSGASGLKFVEGGSVRNVYHTGNLSEGDGGLTTNNFTDADHSKLDGIESGATADQTASEILTLIKTVDGSGSGLDADLLDGMSSNSFLRSDADDDFSAQLTFTDNGQYPIIVNGTHDGKIALQGSNNPYITFREGTSDKAYIQWNSTGYVDIQNNETGEVLRVQSGSNGLKYGVDGTFYKVWHELNDGSGSGLDADTLDGVNSTSFLRSDTGDSASGDITFDGGAGAATIGGNSDIRFSSGSWTGEATKIQHHSNWLYMQGGSNGFIFRHSDGSNRWKINSSGHFMPTTDGAVDIGTTSNRIGEGHFLDLASRHLKADNGIVQTKQTIAFSYSLTANYNAMSVDPTVNSGVTVTVPSGAVWAIV